MISAEHNPTPAMAHDEHSVCALFEKQRVRPQAGSLHAGPHSVKHLPTIAGGLLGLVFVVFGLNFFLKFIPLPPGPPQGAPPALFFGALFPTGYFAFIKVLEISGGLPVAIPKTRNIGLLILGPIVVNILAFHVFLTNGTGLFDLPVVLIVALSGFLLWAERKAFAGLVHRPANSTLPRTHTAPRAYAAAREVSPGAAGRGGGSVSLPGWDRD